MSARRAAAVLAAAALALTGCAPDEQGSAVAARTTAAQPSSGSDSGSGSSSSEAPSGGDSATTGPCAYEPTPREPAVRPVSLPDDPDPTPATGPATVTLKTNNGDIAITLDRAQAPCTVQSIVHLATEGFYDGTPCHRLVSGENFEVLQCGDPSGQGTGGPGYTIPDEFPKGLRQAPGGGAQVYPRGSVAMANTGAPRSGGSQFFLVYGSTFLPPDYTIFGTVDETGLATLDRIGEAGVDPATDTSGAGDGAPALQTTITEAVVG